MRLLAEDDVEPSQIATVLGADPEMVMRLLHLVNASAEGLPNRVDSLQQAIVLLGPTKITGLVMASLISSSVKNIDNLWLLIWGKDVYSTIPIGQLPLDARKLIERRVKETGGRVR